MYTSGQTALWTKWQKQDELGITQAELRSEFFANHLDASSTTFGPVWFEHRNKFTRNLIEYEKAFKKIRNKVLEAGGQPLEMNPMLVAEFTGHHPEDGDGNSTTCAGMAEAIKAHCVRLGPRIHKWLDRMEPFDRMDLNSVRTIVPPPGIDEGALQGISEAEIDSWDSTSCQERLPDKQERIRRWQGVIGHR
ncbi:hypothetical protein LTR86_000185 [Recurvomyces mirabilis]|nr:hypothetical protein LTR86_000185 [Recurvomyces mirabilis]